MRQGYGLTTADSGKPTLHKNGHVLRRVRRKTLDEMVEIGLLHRTYDYVGDGTSVDDFWHLGPGGEEPMAFCAKCEARYCVQCHDHFHQMNEADKEVLKANNLAVDEYGSRLARAMRVVLCIDGDSYRLTQEEINLLVQVRKFSAKDGDAKPQPMWNTLYFRKNENGWMP
jgi:hypothetical protein